MNILRNHLGLSYIAIACCSCREHDKKVCCLGLTSLLALPGDQLPEDALGRVFRAVLELLIAYKDQVAGFANFSYHFPFPNSLYIRLR